MSFIEVFFQVFSLNQGHRLNQDPLNLSLHFQPSLSSCWTMVFFWNQSLLLTHESLQTNLHHPAPGTHPPGKTSLNPGRPNWLAGIKKWTRYRCSALENIVCIFVVLNWCVTFILLCMYSERRDSFYLLELPPCFKPKKVAPQACHAQNCRDQAQRIHVKNGKGPRSWRKDWEEWTCRLSLPLEVCQSEPDFVEEEIAVKLAILRCRIAKKWHQTCLWTSFLGPQLTIHSWTNHIMQLAPQCFGVAALTHKC